MTAGNNTHRKTSSATDSATDSTQRQSNPSGYTTSAQGEIPPPHRTCGTQTGGSVGGKGKVCAAAKAKQYAEQDNN